MFSQDFRGFAKCFRFLTAFRLLFNVFNKCFAFVYIVLTMFAEVSKYNLKITFKQLLLLEIFSTNI